MSGLTIEQYVLYYELQNAITDRGNVAKVLQRISRDDLRAILTTADTTIEFVDGSGQKIGLIGYTLVTKNQEGLKAISNVIKEQGISFKEILNLRTKNSLNFVKFDGMTPEKEQMLQIFINALKETGSLEKFKAVLRETGANDILDEVLQYEIRMAANEAIKTGIVCGAIAALAVGVGYFAAGIQLPTLAIAGMAVTAGAAVGLTAADKPIIIGSFSGALPGLAVGDGCFAAGTVLSILAIAGVAVAVGLAAGLIAGGVIYVVSKPSSKVEEADTRKQNLLIGSRSIR
ncbi:MAG: hypothetical protein LKM45_05860 [Wolbachia endosymbiont of Alcedoecus sp.]|nr:hypothetical protein [Wolbachia endosymbiont of Alcedoecus sp.]